MATFSERHRQAGREQGREQGREEGRAQGFTEGERRVLGRQLELRFGLLPLQLRQRLDDASREDVERWSERILAADSQDEVFE